MVLKCNENAKFEPGTVMWTSAQNWDKRLHGQHNQNDNETHRLLGVGGEEMRELADISMTMREAKED